MNIISKNIYNIPRKTEGAIFQAPHNQVQMCLVMGFFIYPDVHRGFLGFGQKNTGI